MRELGRACLALRSDARRADNLAKRSSAKLSSTPSRAEERESRSPMRQACFFFDRQADRHIDVYIYYAYIYVNGQVLKKEKKIVMMSVVS